MSTLDAFIVGYVASGLFQLAFSKPEWRFASLIGVVSILLFASLVNDTNAPVLAKAETDNAR